MLIIKLKDGESVEKGIKAMKRKFDKIGIVKELRARKEYKKNAQIKRDQKKKAMLREAYLRKNSK